MSRLQEPSPAGKFGTVPYYETIVEKYGASLSALYQIVGPQHRFARFDLYYCMACELVFVPSSYQGFVEAARENPAFLRHVAAQYLEAAHPKVDEPFLREILKAEPETLPEKEERTRQRVLSIRPYLANGGTFLDVGGALGTHAELVRLACPQASVTCCEINQHYVDIIKDRYPDVATIDEPLNPDIKHGEFDFISCSHIIEHIWDIDDFVLSVRNNLSRDGHLLIATPNLDCVQARARGTSWGQYIVPHHCQIFNKGSLDALMRRHGLSFVEGGSHSQEFWRIYRNSLDDRGPSVLDRRAV